MIRCHWQDVNCGRAFYCRWLHRERERGKKRGEEKWNGTFHKQGPLKKGCVTSIIRTEEFCFLEAGSPLKVQFRITGMILRNPVFKEETKTKHTQTDRRGGGGVLLTIEFGKSIHRYSGRPCDELQ